MLEASVDLPLSKSMSARALIINKVGGFNDIDIDLSDSDDTNALRSGLQIHPDKLSRFNVGPAGTAMRFLTAYYAATPGYSVVLEGNDRMHRRPIGELVEALRALGADIQYVEREGFPPLRINGRKLSGGTLEMNPAVSSQFVSALMMVAPLMEKPLQIRFGAEPVSLPYILMTAAMMTGAGVEPDRHFTGIDIPAVPYTTPVMRVERDWSAASYWYSMVALSAGWVTLNDMSRDSVQGDKAMITYGARLGAQTTESEDVEGALELSGSPEQYSRLDLDLSDNPDLVQTLAVTAAVLGIPFRFTGVSTLRNKETDRLEALCTEALKLGLVFETEDDKAISWEGKREPIFEVPQIDTYGDHRMAMAFAPVSIFLPGIVIRDAQVVSKSYPQFWQQLEAAGFELQEYTD